MFKCALLISWQWVCLIVLLVWCMSMIHCWFYKLTKVYKNATLHHYVQEYYIFLLCNGMKQTTLVISMLNNNIFALHTKNTTIVPSIIPTCHAKRHNVNEFSIRKSYLCWEIASCWQLADVTWRPLSTWLGPLANRVRDTNYTNCDILCHYNNFLDDTFYEQVNK